MALRGQGIVMNELLDYRYREKFHMTQREFEEEPSDIYELNIRIMAVENKLLAERARHEQREQEQVGRVNQK